MIIVQILIGLICLAIGASVLVLVMATTGWIVDSIFKEKWFFMGDGSFGEYTISGGAAIVLIMLLIAVATMCVGIGTIFLKLFI